MLAREMVVDGEGETVREAKWHFEPESFVPIAKQEGEQLWYVVTDHLGTPRELLSEDGALVWAAEYSTWGHVRRLWQADNDNEDLDRGPLQGYDLDGNPVYAARFQTSGNLALKPLENPDPLFCPIRFQGQWQDEESGLYYNRFRYYDPLSAQYMSPDPIGINGGMRSQGYVNNPSFWSDPFGLAGRYPAWMKPISGQQRHHIIPWELRNHPVLKRAGQLGDINSRSNMMYLPTCSGGGTTGTTGRNSGTHKGFTKAHRDYNESLEKELDTMDKKTKGMSKKCVAMEIRKLQLKYRTLLSTGALSLGKPCK